MRVLAGGSFDSELDALLSGTPAPMPGAAPVSDPLADLLAGSGAPLPPAPAAGAVDISALVGLTPPSAAASPLDALLAPQAEFQPAPLPAATPPAAPDPLAALLQAEVGIPQGGPPAPATGPATVPAPQEAAPPPLPVEDQVAAAFAPLAAPQLDRDVARRIPSEARRKLPHARCPRCGKPGIPPVLPSDAASQAAIVAGLAWGGPESDGWRCLGCGEVFLSRQSENVLNADAAGFARLRRAGESLAASLGLPR